MIWRIIPRFQHGWMVDEIAEVFEHPKHLSLAVHFKIKNPLVLRERVESFRFPCRHSETFPKLDFELN
ncbi:MAG: hypothetical protein J7527_14605, partial [Chitinophagaceae bacterium]|nr:hypothetical protein [Chitinophagaceae bacterium]